MPNFQKISRMTSLLAAFGLLSSCEMGSSTKARSPYRAPVAGNSGVSSSSNAAEVGHAVSVTVTVKDRSGYGIPSVVPVVTAVNAAGSSSAITFGGCSSTDSKGVATCSLMSSLPGAYTIKVTSPVTSTGNAIAFYQVPRSLAFTTQPVCSGTGCASGAALSTMPIVQLRDYVGQPMVASTTLESSLSGGAFGNVTLTLSGGSGALSGATATAANSGTGVADFTAAGLSVDLSGTYTLLASYTDATAGTLTASSSSFAIIAGTATKLAFTTQPSTSATTNAAFSQMPIVAIEDALGNIVTSSTCVVTLALSGGGTTDSLLGTLSKTAASGSADFSASGMRISTVTTPSPSFTLVASSASTGCTGLTTATSSAISVNLSGVTSQLAIVNAPSASALNKVWSTQPSIQLLDQFGAAVTGDNDTVVTITSTPPAGKNGYLVGTTNVKAANGVVTFSNLYTAGTASTDAGTYTISFSGINPNTGVSITGVSTTQVLNANGYTPAELAFDTGPTNVAINQPMNITAETRDANHFYCFNDNSSLVKLTFVSSTAAGAVMYQNGATIGVVGNSTLPVYAVNGIVSFNGISFDKAGNYVVKVESNVMGALTSATSSAFAITSYGTADHLRFVQQPCDHTGSGTSGGITICDGVGASNGITTAWGQQPMVEILDAYNNRVTGDNSTVVTVDCVQPLTTPACSLLGTVSATAVNGVADFSGASLRTNETTSPVNSIVIRATSSPSYIQDMSSTFNDN